MYCLKILKVKFLWGTVMSKVKVKSFSAVLAEVRKNIEIECFEEAFTPEAEEICMIITEVFMLPSEVTVRIGGVDLPQPLVAEIYSRITCEHVKAVIGKFSRAMYPIRRKKTYLRTALYNEVFEYESGFINGFAHVFNQV